MFENFFQVLCGLGLFLFGMKQMGDGLESAASSRLRGLIERLTKNKYMGAVVGMLVTAVIQSSSATTVMVVGFVNAGLMTLTQAVGVIIGANIGTTVTSLIIAINLTKLAPIAIFSGVMMVSFMRKNRHKNIGQIIIGFGILFLGMDMMSLAMKPLSDSEVFKDIITTFSNPFIGLLAGLAFTAVIQSSSASIGVLQALGLAGAITLPSAIFVIYGQNIGTCATALLASIGTNKTARRTAVVHLVFNVIGAMLFVIITIVTPFLHMIEAMAPHNIMAQICIVHLLFNVITTAVILPLSDILVKISYIFIKGEDEAKDGYTLTFIDKRILSTPPIAVSQILKEIERMAVLAQNNFEHAMKGMLKGDGKKLEFVYKHEKTIDFLNRKITEYLVKISGLDISYRDRKLIGSLFHVVNDIERIGDHCENICELAQQMMTSDSSFSDQAREEIKEMRDMVSSILDESIYVFVSGRHDENSANEVSKLEQKIDDATDRFRENHIERLTHGYCTVVSGTLFMEVLANLERIADHATNIAFYTRRKDLNKAPKQPLK